MCINSCVRWTSLSVQKRNEESERKRQQAILDRDAARTYYADMEKALKQLVCIDADVLYWVKRWVTARKLNNRVLFFGAPFETDAQLVHLQHEGIVDEIITDDGECEHMCASDSCHVSHVVCLPDTQWMRGSSVE